MPTYMIVHSSNYLGLWVGLRDFMSLLCVFQSYQDDGRVIMKWLVKEN